MNSVLAIGGVYLKLNPVHDHSTWKCWWCPSQRLSELKAETTNYFREFFIMRTLTTSWYVYTEEVNLLPVTDVHKTYSDTDERLLVHF
jgi:hypothetical protein